MTLTLSQKKDLIKRCLAYINECPKDIRNNQVFWDNEVDKLIAQFFLHLKEEVDSEEKGNKRLIT